MTAYNIIKSLSKRGNTVLGSGCYSAAMASKADFNKVIKVGNNINDPWLDYYEVIKANQNNPCVPKIYSFYIDEANEYYVCVMERLQDAGDNSFTIKNADLCKDYTQKWITREEFITEANKHPNTFLYPEHLADLLDQISELTEVFTEDTEEDPNATRKLDMHCGNFLYRDGAIVVTDPWCDIDMLDIDDVNDWATRHLIS